MTDYKKRWEEWVGKNPDLFESVERSPDLSQLEIGVKDIIKKLSLNKSDKLLDVGCGSGKLLSELVRKTGAAATGLDFSERQIEIAMRTFPDIKCVIGAAESLPMADHSFSKVLCYSVFHYVLEWKKAVREFLRV